jgi:hypothetical protein
MGEKLLALNPKRRRFVEEYRVDWNATQAAIRAGYSRKTANQQSPPVGKGWYPLTDKCEVGGRQSRLRRFTGAFKPLLLFQCPFQQQFDGAGPSFYSGLTGKSPSSAFARPAVIG